MPVVCNDFARADPAASSKSPESARPEENTVEVVLEGSRSEAEDRPPPSG
ncbi:MAG TPA: hypothetical protein RMG48_16640 [Myxococcales bacterium LLY-WYZ-16_1]|nr:hypothetical protein [Myxococcales bacterium LLY-WYZ-16_1]